MKGHPPRGGAKPCLIGDLGRLVGFGVGLVGLRNRGWMPMIRLARTPRV